MTDPADRPDGLAVLREAVLDAAEAWGWRADDWLPIEHALTAYEAEVRRQAITEIADALCPEGSLSRRFCGAPYTDNKGKTKYRDKCLPHKMLDSTEAAA